MYRLLAIAVLASLPLAAQASADGKGRDAAVAITADAPVAEQLANVERALGSEAYSEISMEDKSRVQAAVTRIRNRMGERERIDQLPAQQRTEIFNDQEVVNTIMTRAKADSRMVCRRERATGSNMNKSVCMTVAQRREAMERAKNLMDDPRRLAPKEMTL